MVRQLLVSLRKPIGEEQENSMNLLLLVMLVAMQATKPSLSLN